MVQYLANLKWNFPAKKVRKNIASNEFQDGGLNEYYQMKKPATFTIIIEVVLRILLIGLLFAAHRIPTFIREVQWPDWHKYSFPKATDQRVGSFGLYALVLGGYLVIALITLAAAVVAYLVPSFGHFYQLRNSALCLDVTARRRYFTLFVIQHQLRLFWGISLSYLLTVVVTTAVKNWVGRPRPDFLFRCLPVGFNSSFPNFQLIPTIPTCTGDPDEVTEGRRSFPSGHSSYTFSIYGFIGLFLYHHLLAPFKDVIGGWRLLSFTASIVPALYCAISRTMDYRHHWDDVMIGSLLGFSFAYASYWSYYPTSSFIIDPNLSDAHDIKEVVSHTGVASDSPCESVQSTETTTEQCGNIKVPNVRVVSNNISVEKLSGLISTPSYSGNWSAIDSKSPNDSRSVSQRNPSPALSTKSPNINTLIRPPLDNNSRHERVYNI